MYRHFFKPLADLTIGLIGTIIMLPFLIIFGIIIFIDDPGPIFFRQKRVGKNKKLFTIWKLRTMKRNTPDVPTHLLDHPEQYITRFGRIARKLSLDELPNIFSLLTLRMSLIGPRPALWNQDDLIAERDKYGANNVRPGITGWAQINGRDELEIPEKARLDGEYVKHMGFLFDCKCFFGTIKAVFKHEGVVEGGTGVLHNADASEGQAESVSQEKADAIESVEKETQEPIGQEMTELGTNDESEETSEDVSEFTAEPESVEVED